MTSLEMTGEKTVDEQVDELRRNLRVYNEVQTGLISRKYGEAAHNPKHTGALGKAVEWIDTYSPEYELAFKELVREMIEHNEDFLAQFKEHKNETIEHLENRISQYHILELRLIRHIDPNGKIPKDFMEWHRTFGKPLSKVLYSNPELFKRYLEAEDKDDVIQEKVLRDIEDSLYTQVD